jgi:hypothetical protein
MVNKSTLIKVAIAVLVVSLVWLIVSNRKPAVKRVIVTPMPGLGGGFSDGDGGVQGLEAYEEGDDEMEGYQNWGQTRSEMVRNRNKKARIMRGQATVLQSQTQVPRTEPYAEWQEDGEETFDEYSSPEFKSELLDD